MAPLGNHFNYTVLLTQGQNDISLTHNMMLRVGLWKGYKTPFVGPVHRF